MNILELDSYNLADTVKFHDRLNPRLWDSGEHLRPEVKAKLMQVALDFQEFLGVPDLDVKDITISGSNAAFNYTPASDIDLHIVIDIPDVAHDEVYRELFNAKKYQYNDEHDIRIRDADVELYAQDSAQPHHSQGIYSLLRNSWLSVPKRNRAEIDDVSARSKFEDLAARIDDTVKTHNIDRMDSLMTKIKTMRQTGLEQQGEFGSDNIAFKLLRNQGYITRLLDARKNARDLELSLAELHRPREPVVYGFGDAEIDETSLADMRAAFQSELKPLADPDKQKVYRSRDEYAQAEKQRAKQQEIAKALVSIKHKPWSGGMYESPDGVDPTTKMFLEEPVDESPDGVNPTTAMFLTEVDTESVVQEFIQHTAERLGIQHIPEIVIHNDPDWSESNHSFGRYVPEHHELHVSLSNRHLLDVLRTTAHELCHCAQHELAPLPDNAGNTGSSWENEANAVAGIIMRDFANSHPEYFQQDAIKESASGYIPTKAQARDPRYSMALTVDIKPGQVGKEANKLNLKTDRQGRPALLMKTANLQESLAAEFAVFESQDLFEINMGSKNLRREAAKTGAIAGMEFEMIVPNVEGGGGDDEDLEPDYDYDQRCRSIQDAYDFFYDADYNSRRSCDSMRDSMRNDYTEWLDQKISDDWDSQGEEYIYQWVKENVDESEWNPEEKSDLGRTEALEEYATNVHADPESDQYQTAYEEFREENQESYDESDWLDDADLSSMREIGNSYSMDWPHWSSPYSGGEAEISDVAQEFENAIGRDVRASDNYHSGSTLRPSVANQRYIVEPDGSLDPDNPGDRGLEFVSPPLPIDEILGDLNKVRAWAKEYGCYTNDSTGLHINISVPGYSRENLDFVKLALLMGDKYVLDAFGRTGNTYAKSALGIIKDAVRNKPEDAARLLDKMKGNLDQLATKAIHSGITSKYTSINTKDGHIEFRSPGGDWLGDNFDQIENTLLRFTVAMSAALNPEAYREEYLTKLYKLLTENNRGDDTIRYFADYVAGKIPKAALRSFVKQAQLQRRIKRGKTDGKKMWWNVYKDGKNAGRYSPTIEVVATSEKEAIEKAAKEWGEPLLVNTLARMDAEPLRPYVEQPGSGTYELYNKQTGDTVPDTEFSARNEADQATRLQDYINHGQHGMNAQDASYAFGVRPVADTGGAGQDTASNSLRPTGPGPWEVYNRTTGNSTVNLVQGGQPITDRAEAQRLAMNLIAAGRHDLYGVRTIGTESNSNWRIIYGATGETLNTVSGASRDQALAVLHDTARRNGVRPDVLSLQPAPASDDIPEVPVDVAQNFSPDRTDGRDTNYSFRDLFGRTDQASSAPAGNSFSGQWRVMLDGEEVWRFRGVGNNQADANRIAQTWLQDQRGQGLLSPGDNAEIEVLPVMVEGIEESFSQGVAEGVYRSDWVRHPENPWQVGQIQSIDNGQAVVTWKKTDKRKKAMSSTHAVDNLQHARREFSQLTQPTHTPGMAEDNALTEIEHMKQSHFTGGKDMLGSFQKPGKKHLKPLPGGTDLMYSVTKDNYGSYVYIVDPGVPGVTKHSIVASLSLVNSNLPNTFQVGTITVDEDYRGRGLARALYGIVLTIMRKNLVSGSSQTPGGRRNWLSLASIPGVEVKGLVTVSNRDTDTTVGDPKSRYNKYVEKTIDRVMELGGQFVSKEKNYNYWAFDVEPGNGQLQPVVRNALSKLYGYDSDALLMATWTGA